jgi:hypothetical protein
MSGCPVPEANRRPPRFRAGGDGPAAAKPLRRLAGSAAPGAIRAPQRPAGWQERLPESRTWPPCSMAPVELQFLVAPESGAPR